MDVRRFFRLGPAVDVDSLPNRGAGAAVAAPYVRSAHGPVLILSEDNVAARVPAVPLLLEITGSVLVSMPVSAVDRRGEPTEDEPLLALLNDRANPYQTADVFREMLNEHYWLRGVAYAKVERGVRGRPTALVPIDSYERPAIDEQGFRWSGARLGGGRSGPLALPAADVLKLLGHSDGYHGVALHRRNPSDLGLAAAISAHQQLQFANNARPSVVLVEGPESEPLDEEGQRAVLAQFRADNGAGNAAGATILPVGWSVHTIEADASSEKLIAESRRVNESILAIAGIPPMFVGDLTRSNYANATAARGLLVSRCARPLAHKWEAATARHTANGNRLVFDTSSVDVGSVVEEAAAASVMLKNGYISVNEARRKVGLRPVDGGDVVGGLGAGGQGVMRNE